MDPRLIVFAIAFFAALSLFLFLRRRRPSDLLRFAMWLSLLAAWKFDRRLITLALALLLGSWIADRVSSRASRQLED